MDRNINAKQLASILVALFVGVNGVYCTENIENVSVANSITNDTKLTQNTTDNVPEISSPKVLSRRKRYVAFPEGSSFSVG